MQLLLLFKFDFGLRYWEKYKISKYNLKLVEKWVFNKKIVKCKKIKMETLSNNLINYISFIFF